MRKSIFCKTLGGGQLIHRCMYPLLIALNRYYIQVIFKTQYSENDLLLKIITVIKSSTG